MREPRQGVPCAAGDKPGASATCRDLASNRHGRIEEVVFSGVGQSDTCDGPTNDVRRALRQVGRGVEVTLARVRAVAGDADLDIATVRRIDPVPHLEAVVGGDRDRVGHDPGGLHHPAGVDGERVEEVDRVGQREHPLGQVDRHRVDLARIEALWPQAADAIPANESHGLAVDTEGIRGAAARQGCFWPDRRERELVGIAHGVDQIHPRVRVALPLGNHVERNDAAGIVDRRRGLRPITCGIVDHHVRGHRVAGARAGDSDRFDRVASSAQLHRARRGRRHRLHVVDENAVGRDPGGIVNREVIGIVSKTSAEQEPLAAVGVPRGGISHRERIGRRSAADFGDTRQVKGHRVGGTSHSQTVDPEERGRDRGVDATEIEQVDEGGCGEGDLILAELVGEVERRRAPVTGRHHVVAGTRVDPDGPGAAGDRVVAKPAVDHDDPASHDRDRVLAVAAVELAGHAAASRPQDDRVIAVAAIEEEREARQPAGIERVVAEAAVEDDPLDVLVRPYLRV